MKLIQASDFVLLLFSGLLAKVTMMPDRGWHADGLLFLAACVGATVTTHLLVKADAYTPHRLSSIT